MRHFFKTKPEIQTKKYLNLALVVSLIRYNLEMLRNRCFFSQKLTIFNHLIQTYFLEQKNPFDWVFKIVSSASPVLNFYEVLWY